MPETPATVRRFGRLFRWGTYPDKGGFSLTPEEFRAANADVARVPMDYEHKLGPLAGEFGHADGFEPRDDGLFGWIEYPGWLHSLFAKLGIANPKLSCHFDPTAKRLERIAWTATPRIPDAALFEAAFSAGAIPEVPAAFATPPARTDPVQDKLQFVHDVVAIHPGICPSAAGTMPATFADTTNEFKALKTIHDTAAAHGARCGKAGFSEDDPMPKLKIREILDRLTGRDPEEEVDPAALPEPASKFSATPEYQAMQARIAAMEAQREAERRAHVAQQAALFTEAEYAARRALPPELPILAALFTRAAEDDHAAAAGKVTFSVGDQAKEVSRVEALRALCAARPQHTLFGELTPADLPPGSVVLTPGKGNGDPVRKDIADATAGTMQRYEPAAGANGRK